MWQRILFIAAMVGLYAFIVSYVLRMSQSERVGYALLMAALIGLGVLSVRYRVVGRAVDWAFETYLGFALRALITLVPVVVARWLFELIERLPLWLQIGALGAWALLLAYFLLLISTENRRKQMFHRLVGVGGFAPFAYSFNVMFIAVILFGSGTTLLVQQGLLRFTESAVPAPTPGQVLDFYLWHFLDAVPVLKVTSTIRWDEPVKYTSSAVGFLLLLFKLTVIIPVIAAFLGFWKLRSQAGERAGGSA